MRPTAIAVAFASALGLVRRRRAPADAPVTFTKDVAPILYKSCVECHRPTMFAPMSLMTYDDARPWARSIKQRVVVARRCRRGAPIRRTACSRTTRGCREAGDRDDRRVGRRRRAEGRRRGSAEGAAVRRRLDDRQARRRLHDGRGVHDPGDRRDSVSVPPRPDAPHRRQVDSGDRDPARRARAGASRARVHAAGRRSRSARAARSGRPTSAA